jgi:hypothetical protein
MPGRFGIVCVGAVAVVLAARAATAQHEQHEQPATAHEAHSAPSSIAAREVSGTAWSADLTPMHAFHVHAGGWEVMLHGNAFVQFLRESGEFHRRSQQAGSINWVMGAAARAAGAGRLTLRGMVSLEPWTIGACGYPDLLATGEICERDSIHDRQHPHDLFMEAAAAYDRPLSGPLRWQIYGGAAGEPALGPPGFPHRGSALSNPIAPIAHHWLDSTHITYGLVTTGVYTARWKAEASVFNGREPDPVRTDFDFAALDSFAGRVSIAPAERWALQVSAGHLRDAEAGIGTLPSNDVDRATASAVYHRPIGAGGLWATTIAWGVNSARHVIPGSGFVRQTSHAALLETSASTNGVETWFGRIEIVGKPAHDLHAEEFGATVFTVGKLQAGYERRVAAWKGLMTSVGATGSLSILPPLLGPTYGGRAVPGFGVFAAWRPVASP